MSFENVIKIVFRGTMTPMSGFEDIRISGPVGVNGVELSLSLERCHQECKVKIPELVHQYKLDRYDHYSNVSHLLSRSLTE